MRLKKLIKEEIEKLYEVRYIQPYSDINNNIPILDDETIVVFHGFNNFDHALLTAKFGLSGKERAKRIYSYEAGNNPKGLFVSINFDLVERNFSHGGAIIEFATKVSNLESPVWVGGRSYFVQGEYTRSFQNPEEREQQRLLNRERDSKNEYPAIANSDRPELAYNLYENSEKQALYIGDLNPNMIRAFWVNEILKDERRTNGQWVRMSRHEFLKKYYNDDNLMRNYSTFRGTEKRYSDDYYDKTSKIFLPAEDFSIDKLKNYLAKEGYNYNNFIEYYIKNWDAELIQSMLYPKQIEQLKKYFNIDKKDRLFEIMQHVNPDFKIIKEEVIPQDINEILSGYIQAALFTEEERLNDEGNSNNINLYDPEDAEDDFERLMQITNNFKHLEFTNFSRQDIEYNSLITAYNDIKKFLSLAGNSVDEAIETNGLEQLGMDIWYTRNHHGAGFFDRSYDFENEKQLIKSGQALGEVDLYINDNNKLSFGNEN